MSNSYIDKLFGMIQDLDIDEYLDNINGYVSSSVKYTQSILKLNKMRSEITELALDLRVYEEPVLMEQLKKSVNEYHQLRSQLNLS